MCYSGEKQKNKRITNAFDTYDNFVGINACANHKDTDSDGKCNACKVCIDSANCTVYKDKTKCPTCGQTRKANGMVGPFGGSDSATAYGKSIAIADGKCDTCGRCVAHTDANSDKVCDVCGLARCGDKPEHHTDDNEDSICDVCGLSDQYSVGGSSTDLGGVTYNASAEWNTGYAKGVAGENGGYLVIAREYGDEPVLGLDLRIRNDNARQFASIRATSNGVTLGDKFVKLGYVIDFDAKEVRLYADGVYVGSSAFNYDYTTFNVEKYGFFQMRLQGVGSICIDSIGIYACDLYR